MFTPWEDYMTVNGCFLTSLGGFLQQGSPDSPSAFSSRIAFLTIYLLGYLLMANYSAALVSILFTDTSVFPFTDLKSLYHKGSHKIVTPKGTIYDDWFQVHFCKKQD